jgi:hypothetical protein
MPCCGTARCTKTADSGAGLQPSVLNNCKSLAKGRPTPPVPHRTTIWYKRGEAWQEPGRTQLPTQALQLDCSWQLLYLSPAKDDINTYTANGAGKLVHLSHFPEPDTVLSSGYHAAGSVPPLHMACAAQHNPFQKSDFKPLQDAMQ